MVPADPANVHSLFLLQVLLGTLTIGPWAFLIAYDILLYIWRAATYEIPVIGGRARGRRRPVAPTLGERPGGRRRAFSLTGTEGDEEGDKDGSVGDDAVTMGRIVGEEEEQGSGHIKGRRAFAMAADGSVDGGGSGSQQRG